MNEDLKQKFFANLLAKMTRSASTLDVSYDAFDNIRCDHIKNLNGIVLEIGPGPGTNFRCFHKNNNRIKKYVGIL